MKLHKIRNMNNVQTEDQINAIAREYGVDSVDPYGFSKSTYEDFVGEYADAAADVLRWLSKRFCLVEKERVKDEYHEAKFACGNVDPCSETWATYLAQKSVLERLFPEIAKEVESWYSSFTRSADNQYLRRWKPLDY